jgi:hypothetical protein
VQRSTMVAPAGTVNVSLTIQTSLPLTPMFQLTTGLHFQPLPMTPVAVAYSSAGGRQGS